MIFDKYPTLKYAAIHVIPCVEYLRDNPECEFEARFGILNNTKFTTGVKREIMGRIIEIFEKSNHVTGNAEWNEEQDFFFSYQKKSYRTRVCYDTSTMNIVPPHTILKETVMVKDINTSSETSVEIPDIRVALKKEISMPLECIPASIESDTVRIKQKRRFTTHDNIWAFDFSKTWSGKNKTEAEKKQMNEDPIFEVECELLNTDTYLKSHTNEYIALSILLKMQDLLETTIHMTPI